MELACEVFVNELLPAIRAIVARDLIEKYDLTQREAARRLDMTQPAISQYKNKLRGRKTKILENSSKVSEKINSLVKGVAKQEIEPEERESILCDICKEAVGEFISRQISCDSSEIGDKADHRSV